MFNKNGKWLVIAGTLLCAAALCLILTEAEASCAAARPAVTATHRDVAGNAEAIKIQRLFGAICEVESGNRLEARGRDGEVGPAQIRAILVDDVNRIVQSPRYRIADALDPVKSFAMFRIYCRHYEPTFDPERWSRLWNGGPRGAERRSTLPYWRRVSDALRRV